MFTAADLIDVLSRRRTLRSIRPDQPGRMPPGWQAWFDAMPQATGAITGAHPQALVEVLRSRPLRDRPARDAALDRWQAFATLWRQGWLPPEREERGLRLFAIAATGLVHLLLSVLLLWLAFVRFMVMPPAASGDNVVQVEFIGTGTPAEVGQRGAPPAVAAPADTPQPEAAPQSPPAPAPVATSPPSEAMPDAAPVAQQAPVPEPPAADPVPAPEEPAVPAPQPIQVTEVAAPDTSFVLPPVRERTPSLREPQVAVPERSAQVEPLDIPQPPRARVAAREAAQPQPQLRVPQPRQQAESLDLPAPARMPGVRARSVPERADGRAQVQVPALRDSIRELVLPGAGTAATSAPSATPGAAASTPAASVASGTRPTGTAPGSGTSPSARPGAAPSAVRGDDWGLGTRNRPGGTPGGDSRGPPGLFNPDGSVRVPDAPASQPPGATEERIANLDRAGTWLKRPGLEHRPSMFDQYWIPHGTLLQEWVRRGIKKFTIPIPGTNKRLECEVSLLQAGGGCGLTDPDANAQPARARPPPDIPFKPHLQEDNGSVAPPAPAPTATP